MFCMFDANLSELVNRTIMIMKQAIVRQFSLKTTVIRYTTLHDLLLRTTVQSFKFWSKAEWLPSEADSSPVVLNLFGGTEPPKLNQCLQRTPHNWKKKYDFRYIFWLGNNASIAQKITVFRIWKILKFRIFRPPSNPWYWLVEPKGTKGSTTPG